MACRSVSSSDIKRHYDFRHRGTRRLLCCAGIARPHVGRPAGRTLGLWNNLRWRPAKAVASQVSGNDGNRKDPRPNSVRHASLPRRGWTPQPRVAQRTLGTRPFQGFLPRRGCTSGLVASAVQPLRGRNPWAHDATQGALRDPGLGNVTPLRGKEGLLKKSATSVANTIVRVPFFRIVDILPMVLARLGGQRGTIGRVRGVALRWFGFTSRERLTSPRGKTKKKHGALSDHQRLIRHRGVTPLIYQYGDTVI